MKTLCITGATAPDLQIVADIFQQAGMKHANPAKREAPVDIAFWHEKVIALAAEESTAPQSISNPGRLWEQLASDIFVANIEAPVWGWADTRSTWLLDYWCNFEPRFYAILVCVSPQQMLARAIATQTQDISVDAIMTAWHEHHQELLRFHHRNPQRSVLVDVSQCIENPQALIERCAQQWKLPLTPSRRTEHIPTGHGALALYLAHQLLQDYPQTASLQHELAATLTSLGSTNHVTNNTTLAPDPVQFIADYRALQDRSLELQQVQAAQEELKTLKITHAQLLAEHSQIQTSLEKEIKESHLKLEAAQKNNEKIAQENAAQARNKEAEQENELLLLQLHQVQEELEHYFLLQQSTQQQLKIAEERWLRMLQRTPGYYDYESIEVLPAENTTGANTWRLKNLNAAGRTWPQIDVDTIVEQGIAGFIIHRQPGSAGPLIRWPSAAVKQNDVTLIPFGDPANTQHIETLLDLATRDWDLLQTLTQLLATTLEAPGDLNLPADLQSEALRIGLDNLGRILKKFPATLRYDTVALKHEQETPDYEYLWLHFDNLAFNGKRWPNFEFRLSCVNVPPKLFGKHPKLEFPEENGQVPFEAWFAEAYDEFGAKLELRFALPEAMDVSVWEQISASDRAFISALIQWLPAILAALQSAGTQIKRPWNDWIDMAHEIQRITALRAAPAVPATTLTQEPAPVLATEPTASAKATKPAQATRKAQ